MRENEVNFQILQNAFHYQMRVVSKSWGEKKKTRDMSHEPNGEKEGRLLLSFLNNSLSE